MISWSATRSGHLFDLMPRLKDGEIAPSDYTGELGVKKCEIE